MPAVLLLCVITLTNSLAQSGHVSKPSDDWGSMDSVIMKLSSDDSQVRTVRTELFADVTRLDRQATNLLSQHGHSLHTDSQAFHLIARNWLSNPLRLTFLF